MKILIINSALWNAINRMKFKGNYCGHTLISFKIGLQKANEKEKWFNNCLQNSDFDITNITTR